uniref:Uncharacterized protein n=1 Tax=Oryza nivara TaxID=4536 RepID=A0A0E0FM92_ORYNI
MAPPWLMPPLFSRKGSGTSRASLYRGQIAPMPARLSSGDEVFADLTGSDIPLFLFRHIALSRKLSSHRGGVWVSLRHDGEHELEDRGVVAE